jgi:hypothetical protein
MVCDKCLIRLAIIKCDRILRSHHRVVDEVQSMDLCRSCYQAVMFARTYPAVRFQQARIPKKKKRGENHELTGEELA